MIDGEITCESAHEAGEAPGVPDVAAPDLFECDPEGFLAQIVDDGAIAGAPPDDHAHAAGVTRHQLRFRRRIAGLNAADQQFTSRRIATVDQGPVPYHHLPDSRVLTPVFRCNRLRNGNAEASKRFALCVRTR